VAALEDVMSAIYNEPGHVEDRVPSPSETELYERLLETFKAEPHG
jgi:hypothetical protein